MSWQDDCRASGGSPTVFPYDVPVTQILPELPNLVSFATVAGWPACRTPNPGGGYTYAMPNMTLGEKVSMLQGIASDVFEEDVAGPLASAGLDVAQAVTSVTDPLKWALVIGAGLGLVMLRKRR